MDKPQFRIPYLDLKAQYRSIKTEIDQAVLGVLEGGQFVLGEEVEAFEREFAAYCQTRFSSAVNSGTSALQLALLAAGVKPGDEVITSPLTFVATIAAILYVGAKPILADVDPGTLNLDPGKVRSVLSPKARILLPVHLHGRPADMEALLDIARQKNLIVIEDAAQAHGAEIGGRRIGSFGHLSCFSFYPGKNLGAYGEGGAVNTNDPELDKSVRSLRDWGSERKYYHDRKGFNCRMETLQGAILRVKLRHLEKWTETRIGLALRYDEKLKEGNVRTPVRTAGIRNVHHVYPIRTKNRDELRDYLEKKGIQTHVHYPLPVHLQKAYSDLGYGKGDFPCAEAACEELLSLPLYPELSLDQVDEVAESVLRGCKTRGL